MPRLQRKAIKRKPFRKKRTKVSILREWLVPDGAYMRYRGMRGIYWYWLSRDVRKKEWFRWNRECITCLKPVDDWRDGQCGHILPASNCGEYLRFHRKNLTLQHAKCNNPRFTPEAGGLNAVHYDQRYGDGAYEMLLLEKQTEAKEPTTNEYKELIRSLDSFKEVENSLDQ